MRTTLRESAVIVLDGSGNGTAKLGPLSAREIWYPDNVHVSVSTTTKEAHCNIYMGSDTTQSNFRDESTFASSGDSSGTCNADTVRVGHSIWAVWTGGDANSQAVLTVTGLKDI
jgi:hypothetical protein